MPKVKRKNDENVCPRKYSPKVQSRPVKKPFKFDIKKILKERQADNEFWKQSAELDEEIKIVEDLFQKEIIKSKNIPSSSNLSMKGWVIFDPLKFKNKNVVLNKMKSHSEILLRMSVEQDELKANIIFNNLFNANWSPCIKDIEDLFLNWGADLSTLTSKPFLKSTISNHENFRRHNFELVMTLIALNITKKNHSLSNEDLLNLAKYTVTISFDHFCGQMINIIKTIFTVCIETAFNVDDETGITAYAQDLYSLHKKSDLLKILVDLFLPLEGHSMKKIYTYITFKLYKHFLEKTNINSFPSSFKDWFVQDMVNKEYFTKHPMKLLQYVVDLLEHIVIVFDLYQDEEKLNSMYNFLYAAARPSGITQSLKIVNTLDQWRLRLFRLHVNRKKIIQD
ncbi:uncharacterized protein LOC126895077 [Daktulosphaira vitifoliae]|uniref:uncharacterized protein LOC126895077 n=1 Tax=Daktulosphaira vitifoliae TaxID=58002 RepID=UPI0021AAF9E1|nr:uncharacterized protein LOC126895077 [Daktulosphaira vitifoliae]